MHTVVALLALGLAAVEAVPTNSQRIVGGSATAISSYPYIAGMLYADNWIDFRNRCAGSIITTRSVLTAAHCVIDDPVLKWRIRVGSSMGNSGGNIHNIIRITVHGSYGSSIRWNNDIAIVGTATTISFNNLVQPAALAGINYNLPDNASVWIAGWGVTSLGGTKPEQLRHVELFTVPQSMCRESYEEVDSNINNNMLCAGNFFFGGVGPCDGDSGGPLLHNGAVVGISSWGRGCAMARFPGVFTRVTSYRNWIANNA